MTDILVRNLDRATVARLKNNAKQNGHSLQKEAKLLLERAAGCERAQVAQVFDQWQARLKGRKFSSSVGLIRKARQR